MNNNEFKVQILLVLQCMQTIIYILKTVLFEDIKAERIKENMSKLATV